MNKAELKEISMFPSALDKAVNERFGAEVECKSEFDFFGTGTYITYFKAKGTLKKRIDEFIVGFCAGNKELAGRLTILDNHKRVGS